jgi:hypothetical protein
LLKTREEYPQFVTSSDVLRRNVAVMQQRAGMADGDDRKPLQIGLLG